MELFDDALTATLLIGLVAGVVELIKRAFDKDWRAVAIILGAGITGGVASLLLPVDLVAGIVAGLAASGYITLAQNIGG